MEQIDVYDRDGRVTGKVIERGEKLGPGEYARVVQIVVFNKEGKMLIQQRQLHKGWGGKWDVTACGALQAGETVREAAARELYEEMGLTHDFSGEMPRVTVFYGSGFSDVFLLEMDVKLSQLRLQAEEVRDARWATTSEVLAMIETGEFIDYYPGWIRYLGEVRKDFGTFRGE